MNLLHTIQATIVHTIAQALSLSSEQAEKVHTSLNVDKGKAFGDLNCNAAMILAKILDKSPRTIAEEIQACLTKNKELTKTIETVEIAGPGFINISFYKTTWGKIAQELFESPKNYFGLDASVKKKKYLLEFVSANPTGPLHVGHGRGGIIGDVLAKILRFVGHTADTEFYINDTGTQITKLGLSLQMRCQQQLGQQLDFPDDGYAGEYLVELAKLCIEKFGNNVTENDVQFFADYAKQHILKQQKETLTHYGITFDRWYSEKQLHKQGAIEKALDLLRQKKLIYETDGATWFKSSEFGDDKDRVVQKSDGAYTYVSADIAYHKEKFERGYDILIDILGQDHHGYVTRLKATMQGLGFNKDNFDVILYQLVSITQSGKQVKMSKRAGTFEALGDVIDKVGTDVARFFYLNRKAEAHLDFNLDVALKKTEENPVYYIQYGYVRTNSLLKKAEEQGLIVQAIKQAITHIDDNEITVIKKICALGDTLRTTAQNYQTHLLTYYTLELAKSFHSYYAHNKIIDLENKDVSQSRLFLTKLTRQTLATCLDLLGLSKPEHM